MKILVTPPVTEEHKSWLREAAGSEAEFVFAPDAKGVDEAAMADFDILVGNAPHGLVRAGKNLKLVQLNSAGTEGYPEAVPEGCALANATGAYGLAISEHMLGVLLALMKRLHQYRDQQKQQLWQSRGTVSSIEGATVVVLGLGDIGGEFARKVKMLGAYTIGVRRKDANKPDYIDELCLAGDLDSVLPRADILAMALPGMAETKHILSRERIALLKDGAIVVNVGRGNAIDLDALADAVEERGIRAGVDVTDPEPLPAGHRLWSMENVLITPHVSGFFHLPETLNRIIRIAADNISRYREGRPFRNIVDPATGYRKNKYES
ncbi:MAG: D-2-hydroxyacid dehydrogenase [Clostridiales bacterium]|nr:D-2-hydroxyacid dehydrogenase [Clostridiales bacterium]